jgi:glycosyltransferase involved in cell wall biosynthesis
MAWPPVQARDRTVTTCGQAKALARIEELGIADRVTIVTPEQYTSGDHSPLATADASVLLSRWDGFPRALRESLQLDVPVLVSPETHFSEIIDECRCGEHVAEPDNPESVAAAIHRLVDGILSGNYQKASFDRARAILSAEYLASTMAEGFTQIARQFVHRADEN